MCVCSRLKYKTLFISLLFMVFSWCSLTFYWGYLKQYSVHLVVLCSFIWEIILICVYVFVCFVPVIICQAIYFNYIIYFTNFFVIPSFLVLLRLMYAHIFFSYTNAGLKQINAYLSFISMTDLKNFLTFLNRKSYMREVFEQ